VTLIWGRTMSQAVSRWPHRRVPGSISDKFMWWELWWTVGPHRESGC